MCGIFRLSFAPAGAWAIFGHGHPPINRWAIIGCP
jgi:hypothetical protein